MSDLKFNREDYTKYDSMKIFIDNAKLKLEKEEFRIINEFEETDYGYKKAVIELETDLCKKMRNIQNQINKYLRRNRLPIKTIIYKDRVYCKTNLDDKNDVNEIEIESIYINKDKKVFPQIWLF